MKQLPVYLLLGEEPVQKRERVARILAENGIPPDDEEARCTFYAAESSEAEIVAECRTYPFFSSRKAVIVYETERLEGGQLKEYLADPSPSCLLVLLSDRGKGKFSRALEKRCSELGKVEMFWPMFADKLERWAETKARQEYRLQAPPGLGALLVDQCGRNNALVEKNLQILANAFGSQSFTIEQAAARIHEQKEVTIFNFLHLLFMRRLKDSLLGLRRLVEEGDALIHICTMMLRQVELLWKFLALRAAGMGTDAKALGLGKMAFQDLQRESSQWTLGSLAVVTRRLANLEYALKSENKDLQPALFEKVVMEICNGKDRD